MGITVSTELVRDDERRGRRGRRFIAAERRKELLAAFAASGLTRTDFARREGINYTTLCNWVQQEKKVVLEAKPQPGLRFAEVTLPTVTPASVEHGLEVRMPDGTTLRGACVADLAALVRALRA